MIGLPTVLKRWGLFCTFLMLSQTALAKDISVFVSFSMPETLLLATIKDAAAHNSPVIFKGLYQDSMQKMAVKIFELAKAVPNAAFQIDPIAFRQYHIDRVPAFVIKQGDSFDVLRGNLTISRVLEEVKSHGSLRGHL